MQDGRCLQTARRLVGDDAQTILPRIFFISSNENARSVSERTLPREATLSESAVAVSSSGASQIATTSRDPRVQKISLTVAPALVAICLNASARSMVCLTFLMP